MNKLYYLFYKMRFDKAVRMADKAHAADRGRYYVIPNGHYSGKLIVTDRHNFRRMRMKGYFGRDVNMNDVMATCFYVTPDRGESPVREDILAKKKSAYFAWIEFCRVIKRNEKKKGKGKKAPVKKD